MPKLTRGVTSGEGKMQNLVIDGAIYFKESDSAVYQILELVDDGTGSGIYVLKKTGEIVNIDG